MKIFCLKCNKLFDSRDSVADDICPACGTIELKTISDHGIDLSNELETYEFSSKKPTDEVVRPSEQSSKFLGAGREWLGKEFGDYVIVDRLGKGGMGMVFLAVQKRAGRKVALKVIRDDRLQDMDSTRAQEWIARFKSEAWAAAHLEHANIVTVYEVGQFEGHHFFSMQLVKGKSLGEITKKKQLSNREIAQIMIPVCRALQHAHSRGILHRDIKPGNIMIDQENRPFLTDFGLAKWFEDEDASLTRAGQVVGTAAYMSPEQATDSTQATIASDVYSLGATIYRLLTGRPPFDRGSVVEVLRQVVDDEPSRPSVIKKTVDPDLETIVLKCLEKNPAARYRSADDLGDEMQRYLNGEPILARTVSQHERFWRWCKRKPLVAALAAAAVLLLLSTVVASTVGYMNVSRKNEEILREKEETRQNLGNALLAEAEALQSSTEGGRRKRALSVLTEAANIRSDDDEIRNLYARYLDQPDLEPQFHVPIPGWDRNSIPYAEEIEDTGRIIAVADEQKPVEINAATGQIVKSYDEMGPFQYRWEDASSFLAKISPRGIFLAGNSEDAKAIEIWDLRRSKRLGVLKDDQGESVKLDCLVFDEFERSLICGGSGYNNNLINFYRFSLPELKLLNSWQHEGSSLAALEMVDDLLLAKTGRFVTGKTGREGHSHLVMLNLNQGQSPPEEMADIKIARMLPQLSGRRALHYDDNFRRLYSGDAAGLLTAFEWPTLDSIPQPLRGRHSKEVTAIDVTRDGRWLVSAGSGRNLFVWDNFDGNLVTHIEIGTSRPSSVQWLQDGKTLLSDSATGLQIWKFVPPVSTQFLVKDESGAYQAKSSPVTIEFSSSEDALYCADSRYLHRLDLANIENGFELLKVEAYADFIFVSRDGTRCAAFRRTNQSSKPLEILALPSGKVERSIARDSDTNIVNLAQLGDGRLIATELIDDRMMRVYEVDSETELLKFEWDKLDPFRVNYLVSVAEQGQRIALQYPAAEGPQKLVVFDLQSNKKLFETPQVERQAFELNAAGNRLLYRHDEELVLVDIDSNKELFRTEIRSTNRYEISGDGRYVAVLDEKEAKIRYFDANGKLIVTLFQKQVLPVWIAISHSGRWLATYDLNGAVRLWNMDEFRKELNQGGVMN